MAEPAKFDMARRIAAALCYIGLVHLDRLTILPFGRGWRTSRRRGAARDASSACSSCSRSSRRAARPICASRSRSSRRARVRSGSPWSSPTSSIRRTASRRASKILRTLGHDVFAVHIASRRDRDPGAFGDVRFVDTETGELRDVDVTPRLAAAYSRRGRRTPTELAALLRPLRHRLRARRRGAAVRGDRPQGIPAGTVPRMTFGARRPAWRRRGCCSRPRRALSPSRPVPAQGPAAARCSCPVAAAVAARAQRLRASRRCGSGSAARCRSWSPSLIALALALAAVRPAPAPAARPGNRGRLPIVLDSSWSMLASTAGGGTRWAARSRKRDGCAAASGAEPALATTADGLVEGPTTDRALIETALDRIVPAGGDAAAWPRLAGADAVHFITDGAAARPIDAAVIVHIPCSSRPRTSASRRSTSGRLSAARHAGDAYLEVANFGPAQQVRAHARRGARRRARSHASRWRPARR